MATLGLVGVVLLLSVATVTRANECPGGFEERFGDACYAIVSRKVTWYEAQVVCLSFGAHLADVETSQENDFIIGRLRAKNIPRAWIAVTDVEDRVFRWTYSSMKLSTGFTCWGKGQPNNYEGKQHCAELWNDNNKYVWNDNSCYYKNGFICKKRSKH